MRRSQTILLAALPALLLLAYRSQQHRPVLAPARRVQHVRSSQEQRQWQSRWLRSSVPTTTAAFRAASPPPPSLSPPPPPTAAYQSAEAQRAIAMALAEPIPPKGDGRRGGFDHESNVRKESNTVRHMLAQDGLPEWRPDPALLPPQAPAGASMAQLLAKVPVGGIAWLAFGNSGVTEMLMNWVHYVLLLRQGHAMVVACYDDELFERMRSLRIPAYNYTGGLPNIHFRGTPFLFHRMGFLKAMTIKEVLLTGRHVLVSDSDVVWVADPSAELEALAAAGASIAPSTDCIDAEADADKTPRDASPFMCGHAPGNKGGAVFNTGVIFLAASNATVGFCERWARATLQLETWWSDDQGVFNGLLTRQGFYPVRAAGLGGKLVRGPDGLVLAPLPSTRFCAGHLVWMQQDAEPRGCASVHATFTEFGDAGKRWRFVEAGLWGALPRSYFEEGRYITFTPPKPPPDPAPCPAGSRGKWTQGGPVPQPCGGEDSGHGLQRKQAGNVGAEEARRRSVRLRSNLELMRRQLHALRDALGVARVLNRTLVVPHFDCMCDRSELVDYVPSCVYPGAPPSLAFPRKCSTHFMINIHKLQYLLDPLYYGLAPSRLGGLVTPPLRLRAHSFLTDGRTAPSITARPVRVHAGGAVAEVSDANWPVSRCSAPRDRTCSHVLSKGDAAYDAAAPGYGGSSGGGDDAAAAVARGGAAGEAAEAEPLTLRRGALNDEVLRLLDAPAVRDARLLVLDDAEGAFGGWATNHDEAYLFENLEKYFLLGGDWCCSSREANIGRLYPVDPPKLKVPPKGS